MTATRVNVVLATYNGERFLESLLVSLANQTRRPDHITLRDDGSTDRTIEIAKKWALQEHMSMTILTGPRLGPAKSFLTAIADDELFDYYCLADQDDVWLPQKIERSIGFVDSIPKDTPCLYASRLAVVNESLEFIKYSTIPRVVSFQNAVCENVLTGCTMTFNRSLAKLIIRHVPENVIMHDWWLYLLCSACGVVLFDSTHSILYRQHDSNTLGAEPTGPARIGSRIGDFVNKPKRIRSLQLRELVSIYRNDLRAESVLVGKTLLNMEFGIIDRIWVALRSDIRRQSSFDTFSTRVSILLNRF
ncbi:MAG: glycosyltransferase family 2 protein [bacterium]